MLHQVDFHSFLTDCGTRTITDLWGVEHRVKDVDVILTRSMCKGLGWMAECGMGWADYWDAFRRYRHALYITNVGRFTFEALREFGGLSRILTILARGFLFHGPDGTVLDGQPRERMDYARWGLCAWCSVPEWAGAKPERKYQTDFSALHGEFPALVGEDGRGWFERLIPRPLGSWTRNSTRSGAKRCGSSRYLCFPPMQAPRGSSALTM